MDSFEDCSHPQTRIVTNLRYNLEQLKVSSSREAYLSLVESVVVGPASLRAADLEQLLGINSDLYSRARARRKELVEGGLRPSWGEEGMPQKPQKSQKTLKTDRRGRGEGRAVKLQTSPDRSQNVSQRRKTGGGCEERLQGTTWRCPDLHHQFQLFSKFGESGSDGRQITLTQSDKWMRQAKVIEGWNVTTTDTAIAFRKISRGSIWLEYNPWREFLEELTSRKNIDMQEVTVSIGPC